METKIAFEQLMAGVLKPFGNAPVHNCMLSVKAERRGLLFSHAIGTTSEGGTEVVPGYRFRTGSITKLFTAAIILQLIEEGSFRLEDRFVDLVDIDVIKLLPRLPPVSIRHLLQHSSGLQDYFADDERFLQYVMQHPTQDWNWKLVMEKYVEFGLNLRPVFVSGEGFHYSDTNYLLLAVLIEQVTGAPLQQVYRERILDTLGLKNTWLEFYEKPDQLKPTVFPFYEIYSLETINTSFDWGAGGLISTMADLDTFIRSLIEGSLFKKKGSLDLLLQDQNTYSVSGKREYRSEYGLGIQKITIPGYSFFGHSSAYGARLFYDPVNDISIFLTLNQADSVSRAEWLLRKILLELEKNEGYT